MKRILRLLFICVLIPLCACRTIGDYTADKTVSITIDIAFGDDFTEDILDALKDCDVKATFFVVGMLAGETDIERIMNEGHALGLHSYAHDNFLEMTDEEILADLEKCRNVVGDTYLVRPPYFLADERVTKLLNDNGYTVVKGLDSCDWRDVSADTVLRNVMDNVRDKSIIVFQSNIFTTPHAIMMVADELRARGYKIVSLGEILDAQ